MKKYKSPPLKKVDQLQNLLEQKSAEIAEKNRALEIESGLENVRSRSLAIKKSEEISDVVLEVFKQLKILGIEPHNCGIDIIQENSNDLHLWIATQDGEIPEMIIVPYIKNSIFDNYIQAKKSKLFLKDQHSKTSKDQFFKHAYRSKALVNLSEEHKKNVFDAPGSSRSAYITDHVGFMMSKLELVPFTRQENDILVRFAKVFDQSYTRFLDLQKAEAQAKEAEIQLALERVRARTMAMHNSNELDDVGSVLFNQLQQLNIPALRRCLIGIVDETVGILQSWYTSMKGDSSHKIITYPLTDHPVIKAKLKGWREQKQFNIELTGKKMSDFLEYTMSHGFELQQGEVAATYMIQNHAPFKYGYLEVATNEPISEDDFDLLQRFAKVFEQTYTRFLDLQNAELRAREAQIEAALERVRSRSMGMQKSDELKEVIACVFEQLQGLDFVVPACSLIFYREDLSAQHWFAGFSHDVYPESYTIPFIDLPYYTDMLQAWKDQREYREFIMKGKAKVDYAKWLLSESDFKNLPVEFVEQSGMLTPAPMYFADAFNKYGMLEVIGNESMPEEKAEVLKRISKVFEQTYTRFLDLQKAEEQAREAQIEAALERVRSRSMAMRKSEELLDASSILYHELLKFDISSLTSGYVIMSEDEKIGWNYLANQMDGTVLPLPMGVLHQETAVMRAIGRSWKNREPFFIIQMNEEETIAHQTFIAEHTINFNLTAEELIAITPKRLAIQTFNFKQGYLEIVGAEPLKESQVEMLIRFTKVFEMTYQRFLDLQKAEAQAREAMKQASLDRVRAEIASMRTTGDLERITPLIWKELKVLNVPFIRCGVFIMDDDKQIIHNFLSTPDGKAIATFYLPYETRGAISRILSHWQENKILLEHWDEVDMKEFAGILVSFGIFKTPDQYLNSLPKGGFYLHFLPFLQGMLYVGNTERLKDNEVDLLQSLARAFSTAYARYEDFNKLEEAKNKIELTLSELKAAQTQLIQSEKMASLGELTAGIAHEIQNPLNFVNNFSEVSKELIEELKEERTKQNAERDEGMEEEIIDDIIQNLEKILHHGQRASSIVKGMLLHSRGSSGKKEMVDINALCDEFLRISYHGFRAKDQSFNADFKTEFDGSLPKVHVIPQDIGRVMLNLINNAFYAVQKKAARHSEGSEESQDYKPEVIVTTKSYPASPAGGEKSIEISVRDNGEGIPEQVRDKIFQPFFTTKPTGSGTGLGLSLSYDIVKTHGGEIQIDTKLGEYTDMIVKLTIA